jgi:hypothetical protein
LTVDGGAIGVAATATASEIDTGVVVRAAGFAFRAHGSTYATRAGCAVTAIGSIGEWFIDTDVGLAGSGIAELGGAVADVATAAVRVVAGIAARTAEQTVRAAGTAGIVRADLFDRTALFFGDTDRARIAAGVVTALFG